VKGRSSKGQIKARSKKKKRNIERGRVKGSWRGIYLYDLN
jgi:hypothetical protein